MLRRNRIFIRATLSVMTIIFVVCFFSCVDEIKESDRSIYSAYFNLQFTLPSSLDNEPTGNFVNKELLDPGNDRESEINSVTIYFCEAVNENDPGKDEYLISFTASKENIESCPEYGKENPQYKSFVKIKIDYPDIFFEKIAHKKLRLYIIGNFPKISDFNTNTSKLIFTEDIFKGLVDCDHNEFLPIVNENASSILDLSGLSSKDIKALFVESEGNEINLNQGVKDKLIGIGEVKLERAVARIDFKDRERNHLMEWENQDLENLPESTLVYPLGDTGLFLKVIGLNLVNVSKESYCFRHVSSGNEVNGGEDICLFDRNSINRETNYLWVADSDWDLKKNYSGELKTDYFYNQPLWNGEKWVVNEDFTDALKLISRSDNFDHYEDKTYHRWRYVTENTLPSTSKMLEGLTSGIIFKTMLCDSEGKNLNENQLLTLDWKELSIIRDNDLTLYLNYKGRKARVEKGNYDWGKEESEGLPLDIKDPEERFFLNYFYWIRHNDISKSVEITDPMEFGIVRNSVYKMCIMRFTGLPRIYDPNDSDEETGTSEKDVVVNIIVTPWNYHKLEINW